MKTTTAATTIIVVGMKYSYHWKRESQSFVGSVERDYMMLIPIILKRQLPPPLLNSNNNHHQGWQQIRWMMRQMKVLLVQLYRVERDVVVVVVLVAVGGM
jgi:hypothetical protein